MVHMQGDQRRTWRSRREPGKCKTFQLFCWGVPRVEVGMGCERETMWAVQVKTRMFDYSKG